MKYLIAKACVKRLIMILLLGMPVFAHAGMMYAGGKLGFGRTKIGTQRESSFGPELFGGYRFAPGWMVEFSRSFQTSDDFFGAGDTFNLYRSDLMLGYQIEYGKVLRIIPKVGRGEWDLTVKDGALIDLSDDQQPSQDLGDGTDNIAELVLAFRLSDLVQLDVSYEKFRYSLGKSRVSTIGVRFEF
jgi:hypothetical protein